MSTRLPIKISKKEEKETKPRDSPIFVWDFTCPEENNSVDSMREALVEHCKLWAFQLESGEKTGWKHYQGRLSLKDKTREAGIRKRFSEFKGIHFSQTSKKVAGNNPKDTTFDYVIKSDTRIDGPWTDKNCMDEVPEDLKVMHNFHPFQQYLWDQAVIFDGRGLDCIIDPDGNNGKTYLVRRLDYEKRAMELPFSETYRDISRAAYCMPTSKCYLLDLPRAIPKNRLAWFYGGLETLKNGKAWEDRNKHRFKRMSPPRIFVFTNIPPSIEFMSLDRWRFWTISKQKTLEPLHIFNGKLITSEELALSCKATPLPSWTKQEGPRAGTRWETNKSVPPTETAEPVPVTVTEVPDTDLTKTGQGELIFDEVLSFREPKRPRCRRPSL